MFVSVRKINHTTYDVLLREGKGSAETSIVIPFQGIVNERILREFVEEVIEEAKYLDSTHSSS